MSKNPDTFTKKAPAQPATNILNALYKDLPAGPLTAETLAQALAVYRPDRSLEQLIEDCQEMFQGVRSGVEDSDHAQTLNNPEEINLYILNSLRKSLEQCAPEERKPRLLLALQDLHNRSGCPLDAEQCGLLSTFSETELLQEAVFLSRKCGDIGANELLSALDTHAKEVKAQSDAQPSIIAARANDFSTMEHLWIISAAAYACGDQPDMGSVSPRALGEHVGFIGRTIQAIKDFSESKFGTDYAIPGLMFASGTALSIYAAKHGIGWICALHTQLASLSFLAADSIIPTLVCELTIYAGAFLWSFVIAAAAMSLVFIAVNAYNDIQDHLQRRKARAQNARQVVDPVSTEPATQVTHPNLTEGHYLQADEPVENI